MVRAEGTAEVGRRTEEEGETGRPKSVRGHSWSGERYRAMDITLQIG